MKLSISTKGNTNYHTEKQTRVRQSVFEKKYANLDEGERVNGCTRKCVTSREDVAMIVWRKYNALVGVREYCPRVVSGGNIF